MTHIIGRDNFINEGPERPRVHQVPKDGNEHEKIKEGGCIHDLPRAYIAITLVSTQLHQTRQTGSNPSDYHHRYSGVIIDANLTGVRS